MGAPSTSRCFGLGDSCSDGGGGGDVASVNGKTGSVTLNAGDVGADPAGAAAAAVAGLPVLVEGPGIDLVDVDSVTRRVDVSLVAGDGISVSGATVAARPPERVVVSTPGVTSVPVPPWARLAYVEVVGGGGGGGGGRRGEAGTVRGGGGGGQAGGVMRGLAAIPESQESVTVSVGAGGVGGAGGASDDSDGSDGTAGGDSTYGAAAYPVLMAIGGDGGGGGTSEGGVGGGLTTPLPGFIVLRSVAAGRSEPGWRGGAEEGAEAPIFGLFGVPGDPYTDPGTWATAARALSMGGVAAGGGGGGITAADAATDPSAAGLLETRQTSTHTPGAAGTVGSRPGKDPVIAPLAPQEALVGSSGGGGFPAASSGAAGSGGNGVGYGGAGGGGGASVNGLAAGDGGDGASGVVRITWIP